MCQMRKTFHFVIHKGVDVGNGIGVGVVVRVFALCLSSNALE